jgi:hypothetical protein
MGAPSVSVKPDQGAALTFDVLIKDARGESRHRVTMSPEEAVAWAGRRAEPLRCVEAAMWFLIDRESKEAILSAFDIGVIRRYFPEFDDQFPEYLARLGRAAKNRS